MRPRRGGATDGRPAVPKAAEMVEPMVVETVAQMEVASVEGRDQQGDGRLAAACPALVADLPEEVEDEG